MPYVLASVDEEMCKLKRQGNLNYIRGGGQSKLHKGGGKEPVRHLGIGNRCRIGARLENKGRRQCGWVCPTNETVWKLRPVPIA